MECKKCGCELTEETAVTYHNKKTDTIVTRTLCRACYNEYSKAYNKKNADKFVKYRKNWWAMRPPISQYVPENPRKKSYEEDEEGNVKCPRCGEWKSRDLYNRMGHYIRVPCKACRALERKAKEEQ